MELEYTFVMIKPDGVGKRIIGEIIRRIESASLVVDGLRMGFASRALMEKHYAEHEGKEFFDSIVDSISGMKVVALAVSGYDAVRTVRTLIGPTDPQKAPRGTIRGDFGGVLPRNVVHASDSPAAGARELMLWMDEFHLTCTMSRDALLEEHELQTAKNG